jgi:hypothetical protein
MKNFISFQKRKALFIPALGVSSNEGIVHKFNHELMRYGYLLSKDVFEKMATLSEGQIQEIYNDLFSGIRRVTGNGGFEPIYTNFPQGVLAISYTEFLINAIIHYWSGGAWRPEDVSGIEREFKLEPVKYKQITSLTEKEFNGIFTDILYSGNSISGFDKEIVDWFIDNGYSFEFMKITFKETAAYIGKRLMDCGKIDRLPTKDATNILRIWAAYSGGDEGLKTNTKFKNPKSAQRFIMLNTLEQCNNLEESFKVYREIWLRVLFFLNPLDKKNKKQYPNLAKHADLLRNNPKALKTFASRVEEALAKKDASVLDLLKTRRGDFMRRLDHTVRVFGIVAIEKWLETNPDLSQLANAYNVFTDRAKEQSGRGAVLASQAKSEVVTYKALTPLDGKLVDAIKGTILMRINACEHADFKDKKVFIDRSLYYRPLAMNNRAASLSLDGKCNGTVEQAPDGKTIRMYVHWYGSDDIDLSGTVLTDDNRAIKVGWNGAHNLGKGLVYSGDNTGRSAKNAEYLDIDPANLPAGCEWVVVEASIYRGPSTYARFVKPTRAGWQAVKHLEANEHWQPDTLEHSVVLTAESKVAYLLALHVPTRSIVYLDLNMGNKNVSDGGDAEKMRMFLETFVTLDDGSESVKWDKINQGHILNALAKNIVDVEAEADVVFGENTPWESVSKYM